MRCRVWEWMIWLERGLLDCFWLDKVCSSLGGSSIRRFVNGDTPQGNVLSPLFEFSGQEVDIWCSSLCGRLCHYSFKEISWYFEEADVRCTKCYGRLGWWLCTGIWIIHFSWKQTVPSINGRILAFSEKAKLLDVILDRMLNWKSKITERVRKVTVYLYL